jgi:RNA polymerase sigma-70 factor (ECF subfamily)
MESPTPALPDHEIVARVAQGEEQAEALLYQKYSQRIVFLALSERHSLADAEDIRAETFLRVLQALRAGKLRKPGSLSSFIVGIALNVMREHNRYRANTDPLSERENEIAGDESPDAAFLDREVAQAITEAAAQLKPRERDFLRLYYYEELPKAEIARQLGIKEARLRLIKSRALKRFREIYDKLKRS